jgi:hypothetical protein
VVGSDSQFFKFFFFRHHQQGEEASEIEIAYELLVMRFLPAEREGGDEGGSDRSGSSAAAEADLLEDFADQVVFLGFCSCLDRAVKRLK